jgi:hypothetical protein
VATAKVPEVTDAAKNLTDDDKKSLSSAEKVGPYF